MYLYKFGYFSPDVTQNDTISLSDVSDEQVVGAVRDFQRYYRVPVTGVLDEDTLTAMQLPRCGVKDFAPQQTQTARRKRFVLHGMQFLATIKMFVCSVDP